jgi:hypothetical protein
MKKHPPRGQPSTTVVTALRLALPSPKTFKPSCAGGSGSGVGLLLYKCQGKIYFIQAPVICGTFMSFSFINNVSPSSIF